MPYLHGRSIAQPFLIIVTGPPGSGKTTLARRLAAHLTLPLMTKDMIKESLFETLGWSDRGWSQKLGRTSIFLLYQFTEAQIAAGQTCIVESPFRNDLATAEFLAIQQRHPFVPIQICCWTEPRVLVERLKQRSRSGERHAGHLDHIIDVMLTPENVIWRQEPLEIGGYLIELDTTDFGAINYDELFAQVGSWLDEEQKT